MTRGMATPEIPRTQCPGWCWDWGLDGKQSPIDLRLRGGLGRDTDRISNVLRRTRILSPLGT
eukprot:7837470-Pyramimonas_sp.AAC.1